MCHTTTTQFIVSLLFLFVLCVIGADLEEITDIANKPDYVPAKFDTFLGTCIGKDTIKLYFAPGKKYLMCFDRLKKAPIWTFNALRFQGLNAANAKRPSVQPWTTFDNLPADMAGTVFAPHGKDDLDRGHLVPNNDFRALGDKKNTFVVSNRAPQHATLNRGFWRCIEHGVTDMIKKHNIKIIYVITRLLYEADAATTKERDGATTAIPKGFSKVIYNEGLTEGFCIYQQNTDYDKKKAQNDQNDNVYPIINQFNDCAGLKTDLFDPTTTGVTIMGYFKAILFKDVANVKSIICMPIGQDCNQPRSSKVKLKFYELRDASKSAWGVYFYDKNLKCPKSCPKMAEFSSKLLTPVADFLENFILIILMSFRGQSYVEEADIKWIQFISPDMLPASFDRIDKSKEYMYEFGVKYCFNPAKRHNSQLKKTKNSQDHKDSDSDSDDGKPIQKKKSRLMSPADSKAWLDSKAGPSAMNSQSKNLGGESE